MGPTALAIASLLYGSAMLRLAHKAPGSWWQERRKATLAACTALIEARGARRGA